MAVAELTLFGKFELKLAEGQVIDLAKYIGLQTEASGKGS